MARQMRNANVQNVHFRFLFMMSSQRRALATAVAACGCGAAVSSSMALAKASNVAAPTTIRPLIKKLGVLCTPARDPSSCDGFQASLYFPDERQASNFGLSSVAWVA